MGVMWRKRGYDLHSIREQHTRASERASPAAAATSDTEQPNRSRRCVQTSPAIGNSDHVNSSFNKSTRTCVDSVFSSAPMGVELSTPSSTIQVSSNCCRFVHPVKTIKHRSAEQ